MDITIRNITADQKKALEVKAKGQGMTVSGLVKYWAQRLLENKAEGSAKQ